LKAVCVEVRSKGSLLKVVVREQRSKKRPSIQMGVEEYFDFCDFIRGAYFMKFARFA